VGKTTLAELIKERVLLQKNKYGIPSVLIVNEEMACPGTTKAQCYSDSYTEKKTRGALKASFDQAVIGSGNDTNNNHQQQQQQLVILDSLNYIKGFRYELYCIAKSAGEQYGVLWVMNSMEVAKQWNNNRTRRRNNTCYSGTTPTTTEDQNSLDDSYYYSDKTMDELMLRYEPPDERNRWDQPLYKIDMRPQEMKQLQQQQQHHPSTTVAAEGDILEKSVYNMHALSDVMGTTSAIAAAALSPQGNANNDTVDTNTPSKNPNDDDAPPPEKKEKKIFKGFKRASKTAKPVPATLLVKAPAVSSSSPITPEAAAGCFAGTTNNNNNNNNNTSSEPPVLYPKDFLYSSKPSEQQIVRPTDIDIDVSSSMGSKETNEDDDDARSNDDDDNGNPYTAKKSHARMSTTTTIRRGPPKKKTSQTLPPPPKKPDPLSSIEEQVDAILDAFLLHVKPLQEGTSTRQTHVAVNANALHEMDSITQSVCHAIMQGQQQSPNATTAKVGDRIPIVLSLSSSSSSNNNNNDNHQQQLFLTCSPRNYLSMTELNRLRQQYLRWVGTHPPDDCDSDYGIARSFLSYLEAQL
jgi:tRNA uridine 5-carbamoylmethylation protein Kti12